MTVLLCAGHGIGVSLGFVLVWYELSEVSK